MYSHSPEVHRSGCEELVYLLLVACGIVVFQNYRAVDALQAAKNLDNTSRYAAAKTKLDSVKLWGVLPSVAKKVRAEQSHNRQLIAVEQKLQQVVQLLKEHKTQAAQDILKTLGKDSTTATASVQAQITQLQKSVQAQTTANNTLAAKSSSTSTSGHPATGGTATGGATGGIGGGTGENSTQNGITYLTTCPGNLTVGGSYVLTGDLTQTTPTISALSFGSVGLPVAICTAPCFIRLYRLLKETVCAF